MKGPTKKQQEMLIYISSFTSEHGFAPSLREIAEHFSVSPAAVHYALSSMEKKGLIERNSKDARSSVLPEETRKDLTNIPVPLFSSEPDKETLENGSLDVLYIPSNLSSPSTFAFVVSSWSMKEGGILPGDIAILDKENDAKDGDIVLGYPEGGDGKMELRRLRKRKTLMELWPENDSMGITRSQKIVICGILKEIRRKY
ncbi:MAG: LexA family protein [Candidatus Ornithospirochaeta sp.]